MLKNERVRGFTAENRGFNEKMGGLKGYGRKLRFRWRNDGFFEKGGLLGFWARNLEK